jgi:hypothetical protein
MNKEPYCPCKVGAGGRPCVDRATCDERGGTQQYLDLKKEKADEDTDRTVQAVVRRR